MLDVHLERHVGDGQREQELEQPERGAEAEENPQPTDERKVGPGCEAAQLGEGGQIGVVCVGGPVSSGLYKV